MSDFRQREAGRSPGAQRRLAADRWEGFRFRGPAALSILLMVVSLFACAAPVGVTRVSVLDTYQEINSSTLTGPSPSYATKIVLNRFDLLERFREDPAGVIADLHDKACRDPRRDLRYALAELSFHYGNVLEKRFTVQGRPSGATDYYLMSAVYAYYFLTGGTGEDPPDPYDTKFRVAVDLYNTGLGKGLATGRDDGLVIEGGTRPLPVGPLAISVDSRALPYPLEDFERFFPADNYAIYGLSVRNRTPGLGTPLVAVRRQTGVTSRGRAMPVTALLRVSGDVSDLCGNSARAALELYDGFDETRLALNGQTVPVASDYTTPLAYQLADANIWRQLNIRRFFKASNDPTPLIMIQAYQPGRIPVVFVHGTASSPLWWAEMWNTLDSDPLLRKRFQFWFYLYNSSLPMTRSAAKLRKVLSETVDALDHDRRDPALDQMVMIGHSQGGLLTKLCVIDSGDALWRALSDVNIENLNVKPEVRDRLNDYFFFQPLPFVKRAVFIATPFRGSFRATSFVRNLMRRLIELPYDVLTSDPAEYFGFAEQLKVPPAFRGRMITSVDSMSPDNPTLQALAKIPILPPVKAHSIVAVLGDGDPTQGNDGVVAYSSAHLDGAESEFVVRTGHSCQSNPLVIEEVRRILLVHLASLPASFDAPQATRMQVR